MPLSPGVKRLFRLPRRTAAQVQADVDDELAFHLEQRARDLVALGAAEETARAQARREFGDVEGARRALHAEGLAHERGARRRERLDALRRDARVAARGLRRSPAFTVTAVVSLALGMGANTAFFRVADALLLRALPVREPGALVVLARNPAAPRPGYTYPEFVRVRDRGTTLAGVAASSSGTRSATFRAASPRVSGASLEPGPADAAPAEVARVALVSGTYFDVLGVPPSAGRVLTPDDDRAPGANAYAVLSHAFWQRRFGGNSAVLGSTVRLDRTTFTVVGVAAAGFAGAEVGQAPDLFVPLAMESAVSSVPPKR